ncbi:MAG: hypothetical protein WDN06_20120 [Asticcacaulis sp.]
MPREDFIRRQIGILQAGKAADQKRMADAQKQWAASGIKVPEDTAANNTKLWTMMYDEPAAYYQQLLQRPAAWLQQPSICLMGDGDGARDYSRCDFLDAVQPGAQVPVRPNPAYFDRARPKSAPQYVVIDFRTSADVFPDATARMRTLIEQNADAFLALVK